MALLARGLLFVLSLFAASPLAAKVFLSQEEAIKLAFPGAAVERTSLFLSEAESDAVARLSGGPKPPALQVIYRARKDGALVGTAYFDAHVVRTQTEVLMIVVGADGSIARLEVLSFGEPEEFLPMPAWYGQFPRKTLSDELAPRRAIRPVSGATLTVRATVDAARRVLALHQVLGRRPAS